MIKTDTAIKAINAKIEKLSEIGNHSQFDNWKKATSSTLSNIYPNKDNIISKFESIKSWVHVYSGSGDRTSEAKREAKEYLNSLISDIENFGIPHLVEKNNKDALSVNVHQHNEQNQSTQVSINFEYIVEVLKGELRTSEIEELKEILEANIELKEKKKSFMDKIKSFGSDVASNILANILTNPTVYEQIGKML
jgi:hypothetical protein